MTAPNAILEKLFTGTVLHLTPISLKFHGRREISQTTVIEVSQYFNKYSLLTAAS